MNLPIGYAETSKQDIDGAGVLSLYEASDGHPRAGNDPDAFEISEWIAESIATVGAKGKSGNLVGVGFLFDHVDFVSLDGLVVHPNHRGRGIGKFIIERRVNIARAHYFSNIEASLISTNYLCPYYEGLGVKLK